MNNKSENYISIGEMAKMNQTTVTTLRLYDSMGLLKPCYIDKTLIIDTMTSSRMRGLT